MKILHLEDDPVKAAIILRHLAWQTPMPDAVDAVTLVTNWKAYQRAIHEDQSYDLLILDICVPFWAEGDGPTEVRDLGVPSRREARRAGYTGPIIFISANPRGLDLSHDENAHAYFYSDTAGWLDAIAVARAEVEDA